MSTSPTQPPAVHHGTPEYTSDDKPLPYDDEKTTGVQQQTDSYEVQSGQQHQLKRNLKGRHMQMIAIGGAIGAGLFVGSGSALRTGGPASLVIAFIIIGVMLLIVIQALAELTVMYPVNGAFFSYAVRFVEPCWGFATGWNYAIGWLTILPFEITAAGLTLNYWPVAAKQNIGVWVTVFLVALSAIQVFGIRGYGEVEFVLSIIKILACTGFIILGIIIDCGGVPTDNRGYIGAHYWYEPGAFQNGFKGFCSVFVTASFSYSGTELVGLAAAEAANPLKTIPRAARQVFFRIAFFYVVSLLLVGLIVRSDDPHLLGGDAYTAASPYVLAIKNAGIKGLPSVFNAVICISVISVANSCTFGSTRTMQALAANGMGPKWLAYIDKHGRPIWCVLIQIGFGFLAFINEAAAGDQFFSWLLALSGLATFFTWGTICLSHIRFRAAWKYHGHNVNDIAYRSPYGVIGSYIGLALNILCLVAVFYVALFPLGSPPDAESFFNQYLAAFIILLLYLFWKCYTRQWKLYTPLADIDVLQGMRVDLEQLEADAEVLSPLTWKNAPYRALRVLF